MASLIRDNNPSIVMKAHYMIISDWSRTRPDEIVSAVWEKRSNWLWSKNTGTKTKLDLGFWAAILLGIECIEPRAMNVDMWLRHSNHRTKRTMTRDLIARCQVVGLKLTLAYRIQWLTSQQWFVICMCLQQHWYKITTFSKVFRKIVKAIWTYLCIWGIEGFRTQAISHSFSVIPLKLMRSCSIAMKYSRKSRRCYGTQCESFWIRLNCGRIRFLCNSAAQTPIHSNQRHSTLRRNRDRIGHDVSIEK